MIYNSITIFQSNFTLKFKSNDWCIDQLYGYQSSIGSDTIDLCHRRCSNNNRYEPTRPFDSQRDLRTLLGGCAQGAGRSSSLELVDWYGDENEERNRPGVRPAMGARPVSNRAYWNTFSSDNVRIINVIDLNWVHILKTTTVLQFQTHQALKLKSF